jgi:pilus assembly protein CpaF
MRSVRGQMSSAIHVVLQLSRLSDGRRRVVSLQEITGMEGDVITMQEIFRFAREGVESDGSVIGRFEATGVRPSFTADLAAAGFHIRPEIFTAHRALE